MEVLVQVLNTACIEGGRAANKTVDFRLERNLQGVTKEEEMETRDKP